MGAAVHHQIKDEQRDNPKIASLSGVNSKGTPKDPDVPLKNHIYPSRDDDDDGDDVRGISDEGGGGVPSEE